MDIGPEFARVWNELDRFITTVVQSDRENVIERAMDLADRLVKAQIGLADTLYRRGWNDVTAPVLSILLPGTRAGGLTACRFDHPDKHSNGPASPLRMRCPRWGSMALAMD